MACKYSESFPINQDFPTIYHDFLQSVMRDKPSDPIDYGAFYFEAKSLGIEFKYVEPSLRPPPPPPPKPEVKKEEEPVVLDGPIEDYEKTALLMQKKFRTTKLVKAKREEKQTDSKK